MSMRNILFFIILFTLMISVSAVWALETPGQLIFKTTAPIQVRAGKTGLSSFDSYLSTQGLKAINPIKGMPGARYYTANISRQPDKASLSTLSFPGIEYVQPNYLNKLHSTPNDLYYGLQSSYVSKLPEAWNYTTGSHLIKVGIIDSGVLVNHPDLHDNIYINPNEIPDNGIDDDNNGYIDDWCGWDFVDAPEMSDTALGDYIGQDNDVEDENFHGTHVAGIIGAVGNNGIGVAGACWNVSIMPLRAGFRTTSGTGFLQDDDAAAAIIYAADNGCNVINMSWGDPNYSPVISDACEYAYAKGVTLIASAGNEPGAVLSYPAKLSCVISVGSVNAAKQISGFSSYGVDLDLVAVGEHVLSTYKLEGDEQYFYQDGTSMSAPFVTGSVALLLSLQPGLSPQEVRSRLLTSTEDLPPLGFDAKTGHGLLDTKKLLDNLDPPFVDITSPLDQLGVSGTVPIIGSVYGEDFMRYSLCYSNLSDPNVHGWYDISTSNPYPEFYYTPVHNGVLGTFNIPSYMAEGTYLVRLQYEKIRNSQLKYNYYRTIIVDRTPPVLKLESLGGFKRYDKQNLRYFISALYNEPVRTELVITSSDGSEHSVYSTTQDSVQVWAVPTDIPQGAIDIKIIATNMANVSSETDTYTNFLNINYELIPSYGYEKQVIGTARRPLTKMKDFNGDGSLEYIAMDMPASGYGPVKAYEPQPGGHITTHSFNDSFWPLSIGNTLNTGTELLLIKGDTGYLWDSALDDVYPNADSLIWTGTGISGGIIASYDTDPREELLVVKNLPNERVIQAYKTSSNGKALIQMNTISNIPAGQQKLRKTFVPTVLVDNLDGDTTPDILCADTYGNIMVYEIVNANVQEMRWTKRLPVANTNTLAIGDFNGDGQKDFFVGGYNTSVTNPNLTFWYFEGFKRAANNSYSSMGSIMFNEVLSQNSITAKDLNNDGKAELILALAPNLYVISYENGKFVPKFHGDSFRNYQVTAWTDNDGISHILANASVSADSTVAVQWNPQVPFTGPPTPANLIVKPMDENSIQISWIPNGAPTYRLYRKDENDEITYTDLSGNTSFTDSDLITGSSYQYAVAAINPSYNPSESNSSMWAQGIPLEPPIIEDITTDIQFVGTNELRLLFNQVLPSSAMNASCYILSNGMGTPLSVNSVASQRGVQLRFRDSFPVINTPFVLELRNISGISGVQSIQNVYTFPYVPDTIAPMLVSVNVLQNKKGISIKYSEDMALAPVNYLPNFVLTCPLSDPDNSIDSAVLADDTISLYFAHDISASNQSYYIETNNLEDLAGNTISPLYKLARFGLNDIGDLDQVTVFPNPITPKHIQNATFVKFPTGKPGKIAIYSNGGDLVYRSDIGPFSNINNNVTWRWDLKNNDGRPVSSGIYFYVIEMDGKIKRGKLALIK
ncbi:MAG: S8 family serine peptidase [Candidatus Cloacimonetes bacterium]|nr:S8 family serine peptidase [Candidatus Cloacimonadota bacterium]